MTSYFWELCSQLQAGLNTINGFSSNYEGWRVTTHMRHEAEASFPLEMDLKLWQAQPELRENFLGGITINLWSLIVFLCGRTHVQSPNIGTESPSCPLTAAACALRRALSPPLLLHIHLLGPFLSQYCCGILSLFVQFHPSPCLPFWFILW